ncbi:MAG: DNA cytosine methyltransferase, partial [Streptococcaceae bacterium]|nr:DNA cytosine methyltransferase [Streptococcaceae bacterium]
PLRTYAKENSTSRVLASTLTTRYPAAQREGTYIGENGQNQDINQSIKIYGTLPSARAQSGRIYNENGLAPTLSTMQGGDQTPKIAQIIQKGRGYNKGNTHELAPTVSSHSYHENNFLKESVLPVLTPDRVNKRQNGRRFKKEDEPMFTLTSQDRHGVAMIRGLYTNDSERYYRGSLPEMARTLKANKSDAGVTNGVRVRKLTPLECWRLQGFPDWAFYKAQEVNSNSQLYKQAGNSVTVSVIYAIACQL